MKLQSAFEFMMIFSILLLAFIVIITAVYSNMYSMREAKIERDAWAFLESTRGKINTVYLEGHGFSMNMTLPENLTVLVSDRPETFAYDFVIDKDSLVLVIPEFNTFRKPLLTENVTGTISKGDNLMRNVNGVVVIS